VQVTIGEHHVTGVSRAGMIPPNLATMLGFVATDAVVAALLADIVREAADDFNRITIDGDTSTNDSFLLIATQRAGHAPVTALDGAEGRALRERGGVRGRATARPRHRARRARARPSSSPCARGRRARRAGVPVAYAIAHSPLVKTAFFASDPNLGRILAAVGYARIEDLDQALIDLYLDEVHVAREGGRSPTTAKRTASA
jgi:glutamate N-acetyltransferase/amino-acid N-acetyltransferase